MAWKRKSGSASAEANAHMRIRKSPFGIKGVYRMKLMKFRKFISWALALILALAVVNTFLFAYERPVGWIERKNGATRSIFRPGSILVHNKEGHGVYTVDSKGYLNSGMLIDSGYVIAVGASHTAGKEVPIGSRYTDLLNDVLRAGGGYSDSDLIVYNVAQDGYYLPSIANGFQAIIQEFPNSSSIIIEIGSTEFDVQELESALPQREYLPSNNGENIIGSLSYGKRITMAIKEYLPLLPMIKSQIAVSQSTHYSNTDLNDNYYETYIEDLARIFAIITKEYNGNLIIMYHPVVSLTDNGMIIEEEDTLKIFSSLCDEFGIKFVDMTEVFLNAYNSDFIVPTGFHNTTIASGHLNKLGHKLVAEKLYDVLSFNGFLLDIPDNDAVNLKKEGGVEN